MRKKELPRISDAEWKVMEVIWNDDRITSQYIIEQLGDTGWNENTIKTLITRLVKKGAVGYTHDPGDRRVYLYYPLVEREDCIRKETDSFLNKFYNGALTPLVSRFIERHGISDKEMNELMEILEEKQKRGKTDNAE
jgi:BlaI family penicillinase repressor